MFPPKLFKLFHNKDILFKAIAYKNNLKEMIYKIEGNLKHYGAIGYTVEAQYGIKPNNSKKSDFNNKELKTVKNLNPNSIVKLCSRKINNGYEFVENYGKKHSKYDITVLNCTLRTTKASFVYKKNYLKIKLDRKTKKVYLVANDNVLYDNYLTFEEIYIACEEKLKNIQIEGIIKHNDFEFSKDGIYLYTNVIYDRIIDLIENGSISICIECGVYNSGPNIGKRHDHGCPIKIKFKDISKIYKNKEILA